MRCTECDYALWNLKTRTCPECGTGFVPSQFEFIPSSVQFCCPHCDKPYYGTDSHGHLHPRRFTCVGCDQTVDLDDMVLRPTAGIREERTQTAKAPWLERKSLGFFKAWVSTVFMAMFNPITLADAAMQRDRPAQAPVFALVSMCLFLFSGVFICGLGIAIYQVLEGQSHNALNTIAQWGLGYLIGVGIAMLILLLWGATTQFMLKITGGSPKPIARTYEMIAYAIGAQALLIIPCLGVYPGAFISLTWWAVASCIMVWRAQGVHGGRATLAVLTLPVLGFLAWVILTLVVVAVSMSVVSTFSTRGSNTAQTSAPTVFTALETFALANNGAGPKHAAELLVDRGLYPWDFVLRETNTDTSDVPLGDGTLDDVSFASNDVIKKVVEQLIESMPDDLAAHRVGDFVFTHHGVDFADPNHAGVWVLIACDDPDARQGPRMPGVVDPVLIMSADGSLISQSRAGFDVTLSVQNGLRTDLGLSTLTDPLEIRQGFDQFP